MSGRSPLGTAIEAWRWGAISYASERPRKRFRQQLRWSALAAAHAPSAARWFEFLGTSAMRPFVATNPMLAFKPFRPYLSATWSLGRRVQVLRDTYGIVEARGGLLARALLLPERVALAKLQLAADANIQLCLGFDNRYRKEGEFELSLMTAGDGAPLLSLAFALARGADNELDCFIGCIQGHAGAKDEMKQFTKLCHGMRPPTLLLFALQEIARVLGVSHLKGASSAIQVHRAKHLIHLPRIHTLPFDYNRVWLEFGGALESDGWFTLPLAAHRRSHEEMPSNKRAQYGRRYAMLDEFAQQIAHACTPTGGTP